MIQPHPMNRRQTLLGLAGLGLAVPAACALPQPAPSTPLPFLVPTAQPDAAELLAPAAVQLSGWLGQRVRVNAKGRLPAVDTAPLLAGYHDKPGSHPWIGEHVGKWLHAATLAWANNGDEALRAKLDQVATELMGTQEADGYLGTYVPEKRFGIYPEADWDVWSHKYCLIGLLTYHQHTGNAAALQASRKTGDLLLATFPAQRSILTAGTHMGMAATSVLEPMVLLYRLTADPRYLAFARYLVAAWDEDGGPAIVKSLLAGRPVNQVANAKAYEMLSNLVGLCELARVTGERAHVEASLKAWQDIASERLFPTGTTSQWEHFQPDGVKRGDVAAHVGETCVTTTWVQFNLALLQLTGEARFGDELERSFYNHLAAAQHPQGHDWCYFTALEGRKRYDKDITCCHSSGPRGMALAPQATYLRAQSEGLDQLLVNTFDSSTATLTLGGQTVHIELRSGFPRRGQATLHLRMAVPATFAIKLRSPAWAQPMAVAGASATDGWLALPARIWRDGDQIPISFALGGHTLRGERANAGRAALRWGPFMLAYEQDANLSLPPAQRFALGRGIARLQARPGKRLVFDAPVARQPAASEVAPETVATRGARFLTFADVGAERGLYRVWLHAPGDAQPAPSESLLVGGRESFSRRLRRPGSIVDADPASQVSTLHGTAGDEDWFTVTLPRPITARRVVFTQGTVVAHGGWFNAQAGKPRVQVQRHAGAAWETLGELADYPPTTATDPGPLANGWDSHEHGLVFAQPERFVALRVIGRPAGGNDAQRAHVTCTELQAFV